MAILNHILGFPRIGLQRELKKAQESYWSGKISKKDLFTIGKNLRKQHWKIQKESGINLLSVGDFAWYDHVLNTSMLLGNIPERHQNTDDSIDIDTLFRIARGTAPTGKSVSASDMTKWFNTNYHYIVPEFHKNNQFTYEWPQLLEEVDEALKLGYKIKPMILGPITYIWLGKIKGEEFNRLDLLKDIIPIYKHIFFELVSKGIEWVQIDEPALVLDLPKEWKDSFFWVYEELKSHLKILITTYFDSIMHNIDVIRNLSINGLHVDCIHGNDNLFKLHSMLPQDWVLSVGVINGRNVWRANLMYWFEIITPLIDLRKNIWIGSSCSLLHAPIDLDVETTIDNEIKNWLSFSVQKCQELSLLSNALNIKNSNILKEWSYFVKSRYYSDKVNDIEVQKRVRNIDFTKNTRNHSYCIRKEKQKNKFNLPILPTTTIGSFPQTDFIRKLRLDFRNGVLSLEDYTIEIMNHIRSVIKKQEDLDLDVLVHGEAERNDMVEYFGENLEGFIFTSNGWVQSYGSRCVKPPIIFGDISRSKPITVEWTKYAQSLTSKPVKGMLTGPITILSWSFPREDITRKTIAQQISLALQDEVRELEAAGIGIIQIDEPALREGLPLRKSHWENYLKWAVECFRLSFLGVKDETQIHTHMCYCEFNDIMNAIVALDADVITIETSRSDMELLDFFKKFKYPNSIGPGVYDIHSPNIPSILWIEKLLKKAVKYIPFQHIWVNPDCGLKTRNWKETEQSLKNMVEAAKNLRNLIHRS